MFKLLLPLLFLNALVIPSEQPLTVTVESTATGGEIRLAVYRGADAYAADEAAVGVVDKMEADRTQLEVRLPGPGTYVFAAFQDLNGNGKLDRNLFGVPSEPYGFSRIPESKWRKPAFGEVASEVGDGVEQVVVRLRRWTEY